MGGGGEMREEGEGDEGDEGGGGGREEMRMGGER